jgi:hypothetical protein
MLIGLLSLGSKLDSAMLAGIGLWSLALYLGFSPVSDWVMEQFARGLNAIAQLFDAVDARQDGSNALVASLLSILPFLVAGGLCNFGVEIGLGRSWAISMGILACIGGGVYELGRRDGQAASERDD